MVLMIQYFSTLVVDLINQGLHRTGTSEILGFRAAVHGDLISAERCGRDTFDERGLGQKQKEKKPHIKKAMDF